MRAGPWRMSPSFLADLKIVVVEDHDDAARSTRTRGANKKTVKYASSRTELGTFVLNSLTCGVFEKRHDTFLVRLLRLSLFW
jgi:hypothetical protein